MKMWEKRKSKVDEDVSGSGKHLFCHHSLYFFLLNSETNFSHL